MPEPARPPWLVDPALMGISVGRLIEEDAAVILVCHACRHRARWGAPDLRERLYGRRKSTFHELAPRLRCARCKSEWVQVVRERAPEPQARTPPPP